MAVPRPKYPNVPDPLYPPQKLTVEGVEKAVREVLNEMGLLRKDLAETPPAEKAKREDRPRTAARRRTS